MNEHDYNNEEPEYDDRCDYLYDSIKDDALLIENLDEAREYVKRYPSMARFVSKEYRLELATEEVLSLFDEL